MNELSLLTEISGLSSNDNLSDVSRDTLTMHDNFEIILNNQVLYV